MDNISLLQKHRYAYQPKLPPALQGNLETIVLQQGEATQSVGHQHELQKLFPYSYGKHLVSFATGHHQTNSKTRNVGVILSGGQAPGGHNVIAGLFDALKKENPSNILYGFLGGPSGLIENKYIEVTQQLIDRYRNTGGFDIIQSGRTKLETEEQFERVCATCDMLGITALVVIGGDDSNTNAAILAEYFLAKNAGIQVIGCPKTIDGDLKNEQIEASFGFDTACKTYSELIGNIARDANSAQKYWHFIKLMGRSASHIALECALQTHPNVTIISEEVEQKAMTLTQVVDSITQSVVARAEQGNNFGIVLIPEGLIEFIPEIKSLIAELNHLLAYNSHIFEALTTLEDKKEWLAKNLSPKGSATYQEFPANIQEQLMLDRDPHGNVQVSAIETEKMLINLVAEQCRQLKQQGQFKGKFSGLNHFFGYEGRCAFPSNFDADYCYSLGFTAFLLINEGLTGYISSIKNLHLSTEHWLAGGVPLTMMMNIETRHGLAKPVIRKALVELEGRPFKTLVANRDCWALESCYLFPGAIQYYGPTEVCDQTTQTLQLEKA